MPQPPPEPNPEFAGLSTDALRAYRRTLADEESRVSYWRRLIQSRLDVLAAGGGGRVAIDGLREILGRSTITTGRRALVSLRPVDDLPPLPNIGALWGTLAHDGEDGSLEILVERLQEVETELSAYRRALHEQMELATTELIARYRVDPSSCLVALPLAPATLG